MGGRCDATHLSILSLYYLTKGFHSSLFSICFTCIFYRCMEATPSLACANKCVFCWRHHTNPVGKNWQWKMDDPLVIVNTAIDLHTKMIKQMKGVPGMFNKLFQGTTWYFNQIFQFLMSLCSTRVHIKYFSCLDTQSELPELRVGICFLCTGIRVKN